MSEPTQLDRIEAKLDALLQALAEDEDDPGEEVHTLDGASAYPARAPGDPL